MGKSVLTDYTKFSGLEKAFGMTPEAVITEMIESKLKGRGGAGFPTGLKWKFARESEGRDKYVICNADEGEPGTFKDRELLVNHADLVFEGMVIAGFAIGASKGYIYMRGEYKWMKEHLLNTLDQMKKDNRLGDNILDKGFDFDISIIWGAGAYICGEESALLESMEGDRGEPRNKPPYPVNEGFKNMPTIINNVETFLKVPPIIKNGHQWFTTAFVKNEDVETLGTKFISISGDVDKPGVYEIEFGTTVQELLDLAGAKKTKAVIVGGYSGVCIDNTEFNRRICYEDLATGGSVIVFDESRDMLHVLENIIDFFQEESCGQCTPCREGNLVLLDFCEKMKTGKITAKYMKDIMGLTETMRIASKCGLGQSVPNPFRSIVNKFKNELLGR